MTLESQGFQAMQLTPTPSPISSQVHQVKEGPKENLEIMPTTKEKMASWVCQDSGACLVFRDRKDRGVTLVSLALLEDLD